MDSLNARYSPGYLPMTDSHNIFLDDWNTQMAVAEASRRLRKGYTTQSNGSKMRVSKPASASTSPIRRRANDNEMPVRHHQQMRTDPATRPSRPVSWHPSACFYTPTPYQQPPSCYPFSTPNLYATEPAYYPHQQQQQQPSPNMTAFSTNGSPSSAYSPLPMGYSQLTMPQYVSQEAWQLEPASYYPNSNRQTSMDMPPALTYTRGSGTPDDWSNSMMAHGMGQTTPPTPESFVNIKAPQPAVNEESTVMHSADEGEGEILVGLGLYDTTSKHEQDPQLDNYRSTVTSLLGSAYRPEEATGKGLTLEEAWEPPKVDEEDEGDDE